MPAFSTLILGGLLAWNLLTDWAWIGRFLHFLPSNYQEDLQKRAYSIITLMNSAKSIIISASKERRRLTPQERALIQQTCDTVEKEIDQLRTIYRNKIVLFGATDILKDLESTIQKLKLELENLRAMAGIISPVTPTATTITSKVIYVFDGDTIKLENGEVVRLLGIDAPEITVSAGYPSREYLKSLVLGKVVKVVSDPSKLQDIWGRRLGIVYVDSLNVNLEMLRRAYAFFSLPEPTSLIESKAWKAVAEEGRELYIQEPILALKEARNFSYEQLRIWKTEQKAKVRLEIEEEMERLKSEAKEKLEELRDWYYFEKEDLRERYKEEKAKVRDDYKLKLITREEKYEKLRELREWYLAEKKKLRDLYRQKKKEIRDPHRKEKMKLRRLRRQKYAEINRKYLEEKRKVREDYYKNVRLIKRRMNVRYLSEPSVPTKIAPKPYKLPPVEKLEANVPKIEISPPPEAEVPPPPPTPTIKVPIEVKEDISQILALKNQEKKIKQDLGVKLRNLQFKENQQIIAKTTPLLKKTAKEIYAPTTLIGKIKQKFREGIEGVKATVNLITKKMREGAYDTAKKRMRKLEEEKKRLLDKAKRKIKAIEKLPKPTRERKRRTILLKLAKDLARIRYQKAKVKKDLQEKLGTWGGLKKKIITRQTLKRLKKAVKEISPLRAKINYAKVNLAKKIERIKKKIKSTFKRKRERILKRTAKRISKIRQKIEAIKTKLKSLFAKLRRKRA